MNNPAQDEELTPAVQQLDPSDPVVKATKAAADAYRVEHPDAHLERLITQLPGSDDVVLGVARVPTSAEWLMVKTKQVDGDATVRASAERHLINFCLVYPAGQELAALLKRYPAIVGVWATEIAEMAGAIRGTRREKV